MRRSPGTGGSVVEATGFLRACPRMVASRREAQDTQPGPIRQFAMDKQKLVPGTFTAVLRSSCSAGNITAASIKD